MIYARKERIIMNEILQEKAKEQSTMMLKTVFRLAACVYLIWLGGTQMIAHYLDDPENSSIGFMIFGVFFVIAALVYLVYALKVYTKTARKLSEEIEELEAQIAAEQGETAAPAEPAREMTMAEKARLASQVSYEEDTEENAE